jgi:hyperosmotically inducible periplasmic protein
MTVATTPSASCSVLEVAAPRGVRKIPMPRLRVHRGELSRTCRYYDHAPPLIMKLSVPTLVSLLALCGGTTLLSTGCAGTATRESTGEYVDDAALTTKVKAAFVKDPVVKATQVKVDTFRGVVQLSGFVDTADQSTRAEQIAAAVQGVTSVKNNITVKGNVR